MGRVDLSVNRSMVGGVTRGKKSCHIGSCGLSAKAYTIVDDSEMKSHSVTLLTLSIFISLLRVSIFFFAFFFRPGPLIDFVVCCRLAGRTT